MVFLCLDFKAAETGKERFTGNQSIIETLTVRGYQYMVSQFEPTVNPPRHRNL